MSKGNRWYDKRPTVARSVETLEQFPSEIQTVIADGVAQIAEDEFNVGETMNMFRSLGREKIMALYKSKNKARSYDKNPSFHKIMNYMTILPETHQDCMATHILCLSDHTANYLQLCQKLRTPPEVRTLQKLRDAYVTFGNERAHRFIQETQVTLNEAIQSGAITPIPQATMPEPESEPEKVISDGVHTQFFKEDAGDMKISRD